MQEDHHTMIPPSESPLSPIPSTGAIPSFDMTSLKMDMTPDQRHGLANGIDQLEKDTYEVWVSSEEMARFLHQRSEEKKKQLAQIEQQITEAKERETQAKATTLAHVQALEALKIRRNHLERERLATETEWTTALHEMEKLRTSSSFFLGMLYFVAGWIFILGDLIISHEIVAYALHIRGEFESWAFAVGLALLSVLLKPAYDHWIERPFLQHENRIRYRNFHGLIAGLALITLGILGAFRYEAFQVEQQKQEINRQIRQIQANLDPTNLSLLDGQLQQKVETLSQLSLSLVDSPKAFASFVLSGILFALAGAICLGLAMPILHAYWHRWIFFKPTQKRIHRQLKTLDVQDVEWAVEQATHQCQWEALQLLTIDSKLEEERTQLRQELDSIEEKLIRARENIRISQYSEGYHRGLLARQQATSEELRNWRTTWGFTPSKNSKNTIDTFDFQA